MMRINSQQIFVLIVLVMLFGAWFVASALFSVMDINKSQQQLVFDGPLNNSDEAVFLKQNKVVAKYFWSENCSACPDTEKEIGSLFQDFSGNLVVESIDVGKWSDVAQSMDITELPTLNLKGSTIDVITGNITYDDAYARICNLFFQPIDKCEQVSP
jgi:hypothetical protein